MANKNRSHPFSTLNVGPKRDSPSQTTIPVELLPPPVELSTIITFVFLVLARKGVMSLSEAALFLEELVGNRDLPEETRIYLVFVINALWNIHSDASPERFYFH
jgi:hypothetical protein